MDAKDIKIVFDWKNILTAVGFTLGIATVLVLVIVGGVKLWGSVVKSNVPTQGFLKKMSQSNIIRIRHRNLGFFK